MALSAAGLGAVALSKGKYILGALKLTKFATLGSMLLSVGAYSMLFGWPYATGMVGLILVHETGHALVMRKLGIPASPMVFIPFMGAAVAMRKRPRDAHEEALVALGGPYLGSAGAAAVAATAALTNSQLLFALADFGFMINLFNMLPIGALDGGRICGALSRWAGVAGLGMGGLLIYGGAITNPIFYLIMLSGGWTTAQRFWNAGSVPPGYYNVSGAQRGAIAGAYFGLIAALVAAMQWNEANKKPLRQLQEERGAGSEGEGVLVDPYA